MGEDEAVILGQVNEAIARAQETHPGLKARCYLAEGEEKCWTGDTIRAKRYFPAWVTEADSELVQAALKGLKDAGNEYIEIDQLLKSCKGFESSLTQLTR